MLGVELYPTEFQECESSKFNRINCNGLLKTSDYFTFTLVLTSSTNVLAGLNDGMLCAGIIIVVFFEMFLPVFSALSLTIKLPNPLK